MQVRSRALCVLAVAGLIVLASCVKMPEQAGMLGERTATGTVLPAKLQLTRRGTHMLIRSSEVILYLESQTTNLQEFERRTVVVEGVVEKNSETNAAPVMRVRKVTVAKTPGMRTWAITSLGLSIDVPEAWEGAVQEGKVTFHDRGSTDPLLVIERRRSTDMTASGATLPTMPFVVSGYRAKRSIDQTTGAEHLIVELPLTSDDPRPLLTIDYTPRDPQSDDDIFITILHSLTLSAQSPSPASSRKAGSGGMLSSSGYEAMPCGGPAGILCPQGMYCDITDFELNIGRCRMKGNR